MEELGGFVDVVEVGVVGVCCWEVVGSCGIG